MNRTIKYRAWFPRRKEMLPVESLEFWEHANGETHAKVYAETDFERGGWYSGLRVSTNENTSLDGGKTQIPKVKLMQYTGLKDKNETEIYEGDLIKYSNIYVSNYIWKVDCDRAEFVLKNTTAKKPLSDVDSMFLEKIGNIYEHPHLIEEV